MLFNGAFLQRSDTFIELGIPQVPPLNFDVGVVADEVHFEGFPKHLVGLEGGRVQGKDALAKGGKMVGEIDIVNAGQVVALVLSVCCLVAHLEDVDVTLKEEQQPLVEIEGTSDFPARGYFISEDAQAPFCILLADQFLQFEEIPELLPNLTHFSKIVFLLVKQEVMQRMGLILAECIAHFVQFFTNLIVKSL